jgi:dihydrofolate reductase (trimethoprim resistance protein)
MKISLIAAIARNRVIGLNGFMPWVVKGEQLIFKALTFNQYILMGRKTFESAGLFKNRKNIVITSADPGLVNLPAPPGAGTPDVRVFPCPEHALNELKKETDHIYVIGGGMLFESFISQADFIHLSLIKADFKGDTFFPKMPDQKKLIFSQDFKSNIDYTYQIWS